MKINFSADVKEALKKMDKLDRSEYIQNAVRKQLLEDHRIDRADEDLSVDPEDLMHPSGSKTYARFSFAGGTGISWNGGGGGSDSDYSKSIGIGGNAPNSPFPRVINSEILWGDEPIDEPKEKGWKIVCNDPSVHIDENGQIWRAGGGSPDSPIDLCVGSGYGQGVADCDRPKGKPTIPAIPIPPQIELMVNALDEIKEDILVENDLGTALSEAIFSLRELLENAGRMRDSIESWAEAKASGTGNISAEEKAAHFYDRTEAIRKQSYEDYLKRKRGNSDG